MTDRVGAEWQVATVRQIIQENHQAKTFWLDVDKKLPTLAGQHLEVRLTSPDGYQAARSYSIASSPLESGLAISVQMIKDGEVSGYLDTYVREGDQLEIHYPIGYHFVWNEAITDPVLLLAGGSGVVPLAAMLRHHQKTDTKRPMRLLYSARDQAALFYHDWLLDPSFEANGRQIDLTLTDEAPANWSGFKRRIDAEMLQIVTEGLDLEHLRVYICGPTPMVEAVSVAALSTLGVTEQQIKTERFGPTGSPKP